MSLHPFLALLYKLLRDCRQWVRNKLHWILKIFSLLSRHVGARSLGPASNERNDHSEVHEARDVRAPGKSSCIKFHEPVLPPEHAVVAVCSSMPKMPITPISPSAPPRVRTREARSLDSVISCSSTIRASSMSDNGHEGGYCLSPLSSIKEASILKNEPLRAEPARMRTLESPVQLQPKPIKPIAPSVKSEKLRYDRNIKIENKMDSWIFKPTETYNVYRSRNVGDWRYYIHPDGQPYYLLRRDTPRYSCNYLTEANLGDIGVLHEISLFLDELHALLENFQWDDLKSLPSKVDVVLEIQDGWSYYIVDMERRIVFYLHDFDLTYTVSEHFGVETRDQFINLLDFEYWQHISDFPNHHHFGPEAIDEVLDVLNYWRIDLTSSADSTVPYENFELDPLIKSLTRLQISMRSQGDNANAVAGLGRMMCVIANDRHCNFSGCHGARLSVWQSVRGEQLQKERLWLVKYLSPLLFYAPDTHLAGLEKMYVDKKIVERRWRRFQVVFVLRFDYFFCDAKLKLERDWEGFILYSTVLLNANVALLSTPIVYSNNGTLFASPAAVASQISIVASLASIIIGLLLVRQVRISAKDIEITATDAMGYLGRREHPQLGLETLAIQYSMPYALLMWGMVTFLVAIAITCFYEINSWPNISARTLYGISWFCIVILILWTVLTGWETNNHKHWTQLLSADWWRKSIRMKWVRPDKSKPWTWRLRRQDTVDLEADHTKRSDEDEETAVGTTPLPDTSNGKRRGIRVKAFGPIRQLTLATLGRATGP